ncbi:hypothetical protein F5884DRAFT_384667 [Xylogone sp. PMI_703]|nr:hypothetical protein F5884DRAFT_384667 [Xylogone sp. PMI_703]
MWEDMHGTARTFDSCSPSSDAHHDALTDASVMPASTSSAATPLATASTTTTTMAGDSPTTGVRRQRRSTTGLNTKKALLSVLAAAPIAMAAESCISLADSKMCSAFGSAAISTDSKLVGFFPFLQSVSDTASFDQQFDIYLKTSYLQEKYGTLLGCQSIDFSNSTLTSNLYARFTTTVICNAIIQNSREPCGLGAQDSVPVCADTCQAESEAIIIADRQLCSAPGGDADSQIRADFTNCALPANSLSGTCVEGAVNEPNNCGFGNSTLGLCQYCAAGGQNSTDTCCYNSQAEQKCAGVVLPTITAFITFSTVPPTSSPTSTPTSSATAAAGASHGSKLSGGAIAGIVIGAVAGVALTAGLIFLLLACIRRRRGSQHGSVFNQPTPPRKGAAAMSYNPTGTMTKKTAEGYDVLPGGRIARMSALEGASGDSHSNGDLAAAAAAGAVGGYASRRKRTMDHSSSSEYGDSPISNNRIGVLRPPPTSRRNGSLSSNSILGEGDPQSPRSGSGDGMSSPQPGASQQSEQLAYFKDYYSQEDIHPGDKVATLWAYQPRAGDEFHLERGDMLKVVGIWDDGWATGVLLDQRAEDWDVKKHAQRDSGVSSTSVQRDSSPPTSGEIKAFPLVCVCLPDHWRRTIEGDGSTETASTQQGHI